MVLPIQKIGLSCELPKALGTCILLNQCNFKYVHFGYTIANNQRSMQKDKIQIFKVIYNVLIKY